MQVASNIGAILNALWDLYSYTIWWSVNCGVFIYNYVLVEVTKKMLICCLGLVNIFISQYLSEILQVNHFQLNRNNNYIQRLPVGTALCVYLLLCFSFPSHIQSWYTYSNLAPC